MRYLRPLNFYIFTLLSLFVMNLSVIADTSNSKENVKSVHAPKQKILPGLPCQPDVDQCLKGTCRKITRFTDVNLCQTEGNSCKVDKECCSLRCDKSSGKCLANYRCATCKSIGTKIIKGKTKCCPGLYPNRENICIPLYPILINSVFKKIKSFAVSSLNLLIKETYANDALDAKKEIARTKLTQLMASASSLFNNGDNSTDSGEVSGPEALRLYFKNKIDNANSILIVTNIISQMNDVKNAARKVSQALSSINQAYNNMNIDPVLKRQAIADASERVNYCISGNSYDQNPYGLPDDGSENDQDGFTLPSLSALQSCLNNIVSNISVPSLEEMGMIAYLTDGTIPSDVFMQGWVQPDDSLYAPMFRSDENQNDQSNTPSVNVPFIKRPQVLESAPENANENNIEANYTFEKFKGSDFKSCRVNLFADYMMSQGDAYYEALFTFLSLDYVTSGGGVDDKIVVGEWKRHIQSLDEDYDGINVTANANANSNSLYGVPRDKFDEYNEAVEQNINDYFQNTLSNDVERKIFTYLFLNGFISSSVKEKILNYYIYQDTARTNTLINALGPISFPSPESFSLFKITRFEAVKYKMYLYKLIGKFRRKSIKLTCRCVDINGPVNGDKWLEDDVKETYIKLESINYISL